jgi:Protein of unknown function DUF262
MLDDDVTRKAEGEDPEFDRDTLTEDERQDLTEAENEATQVVYSGQDFDVEGLVRRVRNGDIVVPRFGHDDPTIETAGFQRGFVWSRPQMDRFVESLLLGFPIPGVFFVRQSDRRYLVLDGQQRLTTLRDFYDGIHDGREFVLSNVSKAYKGMTYKTLSDQLRRTLDNAFIQATIVDTDGSAASLDSVYQIFERLNAGGTQLTPHEIRVALYAGGFVELLESLNKSDAWRALYGAPSARIRDQELILRILALYAKSDGYSRPLKGFLNGFVNVRRDGTDPSLLEAAKLFASAADVLRDGPGASALRKSARQVNAAQAEAIFVGLMRRLEDSDVNPSVVSAVVAQLKANEDFDVATGRATADEEQVATRLRVATEAFAAA